MKFNPALDSLTGLLAIGSLCLFGIFLTIDGRTNVFVITEEYGKTATWGIVAAIPVLVITYILGIFALHAAEAAFSKVSALHSDGDTAELVQMASSKIEPIIERYFELKRDQRLLEGASMGFLLIAVGALSEVRMMVGYEVLAYGSAIGAFISAVMCPLFAARVAHQARLLATETMRANGANGVGSNIPSSA